MIEDFTFFPFSITFAYYFYNLIFVFLLHFPANCGVLSLYSKYREYYFKFCLILQDRNIFFLTPRKIGHKQI